MERGRDFPDPLDDDYLDALFAKVTLDDIAEAWCRYTSKDDKGIDDPDWWAINFVMSSALANSRAMHRAMLLKLFEHADSELLIGCVGAGPLEDFISEDEDDLQWLEVQASTNERLRSALGGVWLTVSESTFERLDRAAGRPLSRPRPSGPEHPVVRRSREATERMIALLGPDWTAKIFKRPTTPEVRAAHDEFMQAARALTEVTWESIRGWSLEHPPDAETD